MDRFDRIRDQLAGLVRDPARGALAAGVARVTADGAERAWLGGRDGPDGPAVDDPGLRMRVASITKMAVARSVLEAGVGLGAPVSELLDWRADGPAPTMGQLLNHTSGLTDAAGYVVAPPAFPADHVAASPAARSGHAPGAYFRYANLNYVLAAAALERATGDRLDRLVAKSVLRPAGIGGGLNWAGVPDRDRRLACWRRHGDRHVREIDGPGGDWGADVLWRDGAGVALDGWRPGHAAWFSPQGGLRASVVELARLARFCLGGPSGALMATPTWTWDGGNGMDGGGLFRTVGTGATLYRGHPAIPGDLAGHAGYALGFAGGAWLDRMTGDAWGYALTGQPDLTEGGEDEVFYGSAELPIMRAIGED